MKTTIRIAIMLTAVFFFVVVQSAISGPPDHAGQEVPIWKIFDFGTDECVEWVNAENPRFAVYEDMVLDKTTGLIWYKDMQFRSSAVPAPHYLFTYQQAVERVQSEEINGRRGWRIPTAAELGTLFESQFLDPDLPDGHPFVNMPDPTSTYYWTSDAHYLDPEQRYVCWLINMEFKLRPHTDTYYVWPVRGGN